VLVVLEGAIRKWVLPQVSHVVYFPSDVFYFLKDFVLLGAYIGYFLLSDLRTRRRTFLEIKVILVIVFVIVLLQALNPALGSSVVGLFGFKAYLWYIPLCFLLRDLFDSEAELKAFLLRYLLLSIPVCGLGILQFCSPADSPINVYVATNTDVFTFGAEHRVRITGTFSFITGHATYLFVSMAMLVALLPYERRPLWRYVILGELALLTGNMFMTGSRGPVIGAGLLIVGSILMGNLGQLVWKQLPLGSLLSALAICAGASLYFFGDATTAFMHRAAGSDDLTERVVEGFIGPLQLLDKAGVIGFGAGATHPGGEALRQRLDLADPVSRPPDAEAEMDRVLLELGLFGFVAWYSLRFYLILALWRTFRILRSSMLRQLALAGLLVHAIQFSGAVVLNHTFGVYYWFLSGFIFLLPRLEQAAWSQESWAASAGAASSRSSILVHPVC